MQQKARKFAYLEQTNLPLLYIASKFQPRALLESTRVLSVTALSTVRSMYCVTLKEELYSCTVQRTEVLPSLCIHQINNLYLIPNQV